MISWSVAGLFDYYPLFANSIRPEREVAVGLTLPEDIVTKMRSISEVEGIPVVFDFTGITYPYERSFCQYANAHLKRDVYLVHAGDACRRRIEDNVGSLFSEVRSGDGSTHLVRAIQPRRETDILERIADRNELWGAHVQKLLLPHIITNPCSEPLHSHSVHAPKYLNVKRVFMHASEARLVTSCLALVIGLRTLPEYDVIIAASYTGSMVASVVGSMLNKPVFYFANLGPRFSGRTGSAWWVFSEKGRRRVLLVADMIRLGTEARVAQAAASVHGGSLVAVASVAQFADVHGLPTVNLVDKNRLLAMGYSLQIR